MVGSPQGSFRHKSRAKFKTGEVLRYHRYQVEWIEALVLSVIGSVEPKTSAWLLADEDLIRTDLRKALREASALLGSGRGV